MNDEIDFPADEALKDKIHEANILVHRFEAEYYELVHPEVYNRQEQERICSILKSAENLIEENHRRALDFGAGTGNLTGKLLTLGYRVLSVDISAEMCAILRRRYAGYLKAGRLAIVHSSIEGLDLEGEEFDLITCYSVLHHLPDYESVLLRLSAFIKKGGVMYIDHEASPYYWQNEASLLRNLIKSAYFHSNPVINALYFQLVGLRIPSLDYTFSDYWHKKEHALDHCLIERVFRRKQFKFFRRTDYHLRGTWVPNLIFGLYELSCRPEMSYWLAKK